MTQDFKNDDDRPNREPGDTASPVDSPQQAVDAAERDPDVTPPGKQRAGESGVGAQRDGASEFSTPAGDGNCQKVGDRNVSMSGEDEGQQ